MPKSSDSDDYHRSRRRRHSSSSSSDSSSSDSSPDRERRRRKRSPSNSRRRRKSRDRSRDRSRRSRSRHRSSSRDRRDRRKDKRRRTRSRSPKYSSRRTRRSRSSSSDSEKRDGYHRDDRRDSAKKSGSPSRSQDSSREAFVIEPQSEAERSRLIESIENAGFKQQAFVSKRNQQQKNSEEKLNHDAHVAAIFNTTTLEEFLANQAKKPPKLTDYEGNPESLLHENLYDDFERRNEKWRKKLHSERRKYLNTTSS